MSHIGRVIAAQRALMGIRQGELAKRCGLAQRRLSEIETGRTQPNPELLALIMEALAGES